MYFYEERKFRNLKNEYKKTLKNEGLSSKNRRNENSKPGTLWEISVS